MRCAGTRPFPHFLLYKALEVESCFIEFGSMLNIRAWGDKPIARTVRVSVPRSLRKRLGRTVEAAA